MWLQATTYTCPLYACLLSLIVNVGQDLVGKQLLCFSYGSGCAASMFGVRVVGVPLHPPDILDRLRNRTPKSIATALPLIQAFDNMYGKFGFEPSHRDDRQHGAFYLKSVDEKGVRSYERHEKRKSIAVHRERDRPVTWIEFLQETLDADMVTDLTKALEPGRIHVFTCEGENFCVGASASGEIDMQTFLKGTAGFAALHKKLEECCELPIIVLCNGATRGGGMLFPNMAHVVIATADATFGYPEVRRGVLPGVVSVSAQRRMSRRQCRRWMLTGHVFDAASAKSRGVVDAIVETSREEARSKLRIIIDELLILPTELLRSRCRIMAADGNLDVALIEAGNLNLSQSNRLVQTAECVKLTWHGTSVACLELVDPDGNGNLLSWNTVTCLAGHIQELHASCDVRAVMLLLHTRDKPAHETQDLFAWVMSVTGNSAHEKLVSTAAVLNHLVRLCKHSLSQLPVPVIAVLQGNFCGAWLALALSTDYRIAVEGTRFLFDEHNLDGLFEIASTAGIIIGESHWNRFSRESPDLVMSSGIALQLNLVVSVHDSAALAFQNALKLSQQIVSAPSAGIRNAISLLRMSLNTKAAASKCARMARKMVGFEQFGSVENPSDGCSQLDIEDFGFAISIKLIQETTTQQLYEALVNTAGSSSGGKPILIVQSSVGDLEHFQTIDHSLITLIEWFRSEKRRPTVVVTSHGSGLSVLLPLLADVRVATPSSSFRTFRFDTVVHACLASKLGVAGCGRFMFLGGGNLSSLNASDIGIVENLVDFPEQTEKYLTAIWASGGLKWHQPPSLSFAEAVFLEAEMAKSVLFESGEATVDWKENGLAQIRLTSVEKLELALDAVERSQGLKAVCIHASDESGALFLSDSTFMTRIRFFAAVLRTKRRLHSLSVPVCAMLSGRVSVLGAVVACSSTFRVGNTTTLFDFTDALFSSVILDLLDALPSIIGIAEAEELRLRRPVLDAANALACGLLTSVIDGVPSVNDFVCESPYRGFSLALQEELGIPLLEQSMRCLAISKGMESVEIMPSHKICVEVDVAEGGRVIHLKITSSVLTQGSVQTIERALQADRSICVIHFEPEYKDASVDSESSYSASVVDCVLSHNMPVIAVCQSCGVLESREMLQVMSAADVVILNRSVNDELLRKIRVTSHRANSHWNHHCWNRFDLVDIVVDDANVESEVAKVIHRFNQINPDLLKACKVHLPVSTVEESRLVMATLRESRSTHGQKVDLNLVRLEVSSDGVAIVELNDPNRFNAETPELVSALRARILEVEALALQGVVRSMVLQGAGAHFCTGGFVKEDKFQFAVYSSDVPDALSVLQEISDMSSIAARLRALPIPTLAAVHGKVIGGGLALCLAVDWRVSTNDTRFVFGNISRGMSPIFMLSRSLPLTVGWGCAMRMYLEDNVVTANTALENCLINSTTDAQFEAKQLALNMAKSVRTVGKQYFRGRIGRTCARDSAHSSKEITKLVDTIDALQRLESSVSLGEESRDQGIEVSQDHWLVRSMSPQLDDSVEMIRPKDVLELHAMVLARMDFQEPLCILASDDELAAYARTVRAECPGWALQSIVTTEKPAGAPIDWETGDWKLERGSWSVRQLKSVPTLNQLVVAVKLTERGSLANLRVVEARRAAVTAGKIQVLVRAVGLNFRDVLNVLGEVPYPGPLGLECSGVVVGVGEGVTEFGVGDRVFGVVRGAFESYVMSRPEYFRHILSDVSFEVAASLPILITTVHHALVELANLERGQRVLIHAGAGGVGLVAIYYAQRLQCEVIATVGSEVKREHLLRMGVTHIASSRDAESFRDSMATFGEVDVVLNSLSGDFIKHSLAALKMGGHFCEIGQRGIWSDSDVSALRSDVQYHVILLDDMMSNQPLNFKKLFHDSVSFGLPELPLTCFALDHAVDAFRYMMAAKHIGKIILTQRALFNGEGTYLISGGFGYIGRLVTSALIENGARKIVLLSSTRSTLPDDWSANVRPAVVRCDVGQLSEVQRVFDCYKDVRGVIHAAGVLSDGTLKNLRADDFERVYRPKVHGARNLDECSRGLPLDFFVVFSCASGGIGQATYAAANGFLDSVAQRRVDEGLEGLSVRWGAWSGKLMAAEQGTMNLGSRSGLMSSYESDTLLRLILYTKNIASVSVLPLSNKVTGIPFIERKPVSSRLDYGMIFGSRLDPGSGSEQRRSAIRETILPLLATVGIPDISGTIPWGEAGLDSLSMVELRNMLSTVLGEAMSLSSTLLFDYPNLDALVHHIDATLFPQVSSQAVVYRTAGAEPLAIVGMAFRCGGGVYDLRSLWGFLEDRGDAMREIPLDRMDWRKLYDPEPGKVGKIYTNRAAFLEGALLFDHERFGITTAEALVMVPQQRLALEAACEALAQAGVNQPEGGHEGQNRKVGTFVAEARSSTVVSDFSSAFAATGAAQSITANRLAYVYGLSAPSMTIDTACSSGLVALDAAVKAIYNHDCEAAVIVGINVMKSADDFVAMCAARMLSPNGRCATFSDEADGYARGEGCAAVVLKPLSKALDDGNGIWGVVYGTAVNQDGRTATLTAPKGPAQEEVIRTALQRASVIAEDICYIEAHGTGTPLGDPIEVGALSHVFQGRNSPLLIGALKANIGHTEACSGLASLIKAVLCLHHRRVPPNIHCERLNPRVLDAVGQSFFVFPQVSTELTGNYAGVSSFGFGGTNSHVIIGTKPTGIPTPVEPQIIWNRSQFPWQHEAHPLVGVYERQGKRNVWTCRWDASVIDYLSNHRVRDISIVPGVCYLEMVAPGVQHLFGDVPYELRDVRFSHALYLHRDAFPTVRLIISPDDSQKEEKEYQVVVESVQGNSRTEHAHMRLFLCERVTENIEVAQAYETFEYPTISGEGFYHSISNIYSKEFRSLKSIKRGIASESWGLVEIEEEVEVSGCLRWCALMECAIHVGVDGLEDSERLGNLVLTGFRSWYVSGVNRDTDIKVWSHWNIEGTESCMRVYDKTGKLRSRMLGIQSKPNDVEVHMTVGVDEWVERQMAPSLNTTESIRLDNVLELHSMVVARMNEQAPLCVLAVDQEIAAYLRTVRAECQGWQLQCIETTERVDGVPVEWEEGDWRFAGGKWSVRRLKLRSLLPPFVRAVQLKERGKTPSLSVLKAKRTPPGSDEVEVLVRAVGLNSDDLLNVLGLDPANQGPPGSDFSGVVVSVGSSVGGLRAGDHVFGIAQGPLNTFVRAQPGNLSRLPIEISFDSAACLPTLIIMVSVALLDFAKLCKGQSVLVHAGAGCFGLVAIHYVQQLGCKVVATFESEDERNLLKKVGVEQIAPSNDVEAFRLNMAAFGAVDVVLNSGGFRENLLQSLRFGGCFCECGKDGVQLETDVARERKDIVHHIISLDTIMSNGPASFTELFERAMTFVLPDLPKICFPLERAAEAFLYMQREPAEKIVLTQKAPFEDSGTLLISGGLGYIGLHVSRALILHGARKIVLLSSTRSTLPSDWDLEVRPAVIKCNVSNFEEVRQIFDIHRDIKGVIHAAGTLSDRTLERLTADDFEVVYQPKVLGAQNLDICTRGLNLDFFVLFSSVASGFGNPGQANYAAANGYLDSLAERREREGLAGLSLRWGPWSGGGMAANGSDKVSNDGLLPIPLNAGIDYLLQFLIHSVPDTVVTVCNFSPSKHPQSYYFSNVFSMEAKKSNFWLDSLRALEKHERTIALQDKVCWLLASIGVTDIADYSTPWVEVGLDSLSMVELRNGLLKILGDSVPLSTTVLFDYPNLDALVHHIESNLFPEVEGQLVAYRATRMEPLAIVGMACRTGGCVDNIPSFWSFLERKGDAMIQIPLERMDWRKLYKPGEAGKIYTNIGGFIDKTMMFDNQRFGISAAEAQQMDPQKRVGLEMAYEALLQAGVRMETAEKRSIGIFVAEATRDFVLLPSAVFNSPYSGTGWSSSITANRISYLYGMNSPSMTIDTACSSGLVALDAACKAIYDHDCEAAVVLGVGLMLTLDAYESCCAGGTISPRGRCAAFSSEADGYSRGEACSAVVLKPLGRAVKDGDGIWGVVHGTAVNQNGRTVRMAAPSGLAQEEVIRTALDRAGLMPNDIGYVESHGTGTPLGDPIEAGGLGHVFKGRQLPLLVGALKSNIGHTEAVSGLMGLIKAVLCLHHGRVPANLHCERLNPRLMEALVDCPMVFPQDSVALTGLHAGVSSFGLGGTNAHVVLGVAPLNSPEPRQPDVVWLREPFPWQTDWHPLLGSLDRQSDRCVWTCKWDSAVVEYLTDHKLIEAPVVPAVCFLEMVAPAVGQLFGNVPYELRDVHLDSLLYLEAGSFPSVRLTMHLKRPGSANEVREHEVSVESFVSVDGWVEHARMQVRVCDRQPDPVLQVEDVIKRCGEGITCADEFYSTLGNLYDGDFRSLYQVWRGRAGEALGQIKVRGERDVPGCLRWCALIDCALQVGIEGLSVTERVGGPDLYCTELVSMYVPGVLRELNDAAWSHWEENACGHESSISIYDESGHLLARISGMRLTSGKSKNLSPIVSLDEWVALTLPPRLDENVEKIRPSNVFELHLMVDSRMVAQAPLCVLAADEEMAAFVRAVRAECPGWRLQCVITAEEPVGAPAEWDEGDWRFSQESWSIRRLKWAPALPPLTQAVLFGGKGTYVISGGLGYMGQLVAKSLIRHGAQRIVLLSSTRSELPEDWDLDVRPEVVKCNLGELGDVRRVFETYLDVRGVIHAAGASPSGTSGVNNKTRSDFEKVYLPKVRGAQNLDECVQGLSLDFFVLMSSISSTFSFAGAGVAEYAAANGFLNALSERRFRQGLPYISVQWGAWTGGGMALDTVHRTMARLGALPVQPDHGIKVLLQVIHCRPTMDAVIVCPLSLTKLPVSAYFSKIVSTEQKSVLQLRKFRSDRIERSSVLAMNDGKNSIRSTIQSLLNGVGLENIGPRIPWGDAGLDSIGMLELRNNLSKALGDSMQLSSTVLFDYPNFEALVCHIEGTLFPSVSWDAINHTVNHEPLAIVGMACLLGGGIKCGQSLWAFLEYGGDVMMEIPLERMDWTKLYNPKSTMAGKLYTNRAALIDQAMLFDNARFGISTSEAREMKPQQRLALQTAYVALLEAGVLIDGNARRAIGTFVAESGFSGFASQESGIMQNNTGSSPYTATGAAHSITANRLAYIYGLSSPSMTIDTACSSSLVAIDTACKAICYGDCEEAVVVGVNIILSAEELIPLCSSRMLSPNGRCATFSDQADGYARGEGCAAVVLKPLSKALKDGNGIWGVVHGTAVNQDGRTATLTAPNGPAQEEVIRTALQRAGVTPNEVGYVEAHGTGTPLGDPIEAGALARVFKGRPTPLVVGALKANIGHTEAASGLAGLIKAVLCLHHGRAPPNIHCERLNPLLAEALAECPLVFPRKSTVLLGRYAGVSSFGFGGTNAHAVVGPAPDGSQAPVQPLIDWHCVSFPWRPDSFHPMLQNHLRLSSEATLFVAKLDSALISFLRTPLQLYVEMLFAVFSQWSHGNFEKFTAVVFEIKIESRNSTPEEGHMLQCEVTTGGTFSIKMNSKKNEYETVAAGHFWTKLDHVLIDAMSSAFHNRSSISTTAQEILLGRSVAEVFLGDGVAYAYVSLIQDNGSGSLSASAQFLDAMICLCVHAAGENNFDKTVTVVGIDQLQHFRKLEIGTGWVYATCVGFERRCSLVDVAFFASNEDPVLYMKGVRLLHKLKVPPATLESSYIPNFPADVGIIAIEYYCPNLCVNARDIEEHQGRQSQYTIGRGQENVTFCSDDEDAVSMAMTAFERLINRCELEYSEIGRLEVGTECQVDRAKSIKSFLMELFARDGLCDVEGADTYNACYGGTNALFNAVNWVQSGAWNGKYAVVICTDTAVHTDPDHLQAVGASALALLIGPRAHLVLEPQRVSFMKHTWDFYRPIGWHNNEPIYNVDMATAQYDEALIWCQNEFTRKIGNQDLLSVYSFVAFHCNAPYHAKRSLRLLCNAIHGRELSRDEHDALYKRYVEAGTSISAQNVRIDFNYLLCSCAYDP